jgi:hypothetical protein
VSSETFATQSVADFYKTINSVKDAENARQLETLVVESVHDQVRGGQQLVECLCVPL